MSESLLRSQSLEDFAPGRPAGGDSHRPS